MLFEVYWNLVDKHGYEPDWINLDLKSGKPIAGNKLALKLVVDGLKLQPCQPSFVDARDAILLADRVYTTGANYCDIYTAFAKRGLGVKALSGGREDFTLPDECKK